ncbi:MAG: BglG family transcription antiterminator [Sarcina sp.]
MKLTIRQKKILTLIYEKKEEYITLSEISKHLEISTRTISREIDSIEQYLKQFSCVLEKKTGIGFKVLGKMDDLKWLGEELWDSVEEKIYSKQERKIILILELLKLEEPIKIFALTRMLNVAEGTISSDLAIVDRWFKKIGIKLFRKSGVGIFIKATEREIRQALIKLLYENIKYKNILNLVINDEKFLGKIVEEREFSIIERNLINSIKLSLEDLKTNQSVDISDNLYIPMIIHISMVVQRIKLGFILEENEDYIKLESTEEFVFAKLIMEKVANDFEIEINNSEIAYIADRIIGVNRGVENSLSKKESQIIERELESFLIELEGKKGIFLNRNTENYQQLILHINIAIKRIKSNMKVRNPILNEILERYKELFILTVDFSKRLEDVFNIKISEDEIGFITLHIGAILEHSIKKVKQNYRAIVVCPTGIGSSILLANRIEKTFENIKIVSKVSILNMHKVDFKAEKIDFIISTVKIKNAPITMVSIGPWLNKDDKNKLIDFTNNYKRAMDDRREIKNRVDESFKNHVLRMKNYTTGIREILENFFMFEKSYNNIESIISEVSKKISLENADIISQDLIAREKKGSTIINDKDVILLHCRTNGVKEIYFGFIKVEESIKLLNEGIMQEIKYIFIMIAPSKASEEQMEVLSNISSTFISEENIMHRFINGNYIESYNIITEIMKDFYEIKK